MENTVLLDDKQILEQDLLEASEAVADEDATEGSQEPETSEALFEGLTAGEDTGESSGGISGAGSSSDGNTVDGTGTDTGSGTSQAEESELPYSAAVDEELNAQILVLLQNQQELQTQLLETQEHLLVSNQRLELQNEACISILLIFVIVGLLNYIYKFFKMFF